MPVIDPHAIYEGLTAAAHRNAASRAHRLAKRAAEQGAHATADDWRTQAAKHEHWADEQERFDRAITGDETMPNAHDIDPDDVRAVLVYFCGPELEWPWGDDRKSATERAAFERVVARL